MTNDFSPVPAIPAGTGPFFIRSTPPTIGASVMPRTGTPGLYAVPFEDTPEALAIRAHEYGHLALFAGFLNESAFSTALAQHGVRPDWAQAGLDVMVNAFLKERGVIEIQHLPVTRLGYNPHPDTVARLRLQTYGLPTKAFSKNDRINNAVDLVAAQLVHLVDIAVHSDRLINARYVAQLLGSVQTVSDYLLKESPGDSESLERSVLSGSIRSIALAKPPWGPMRIITLPLSRPVRAALDANKRVAGYVGAFLYPHRVLSDGAIFGYRRRARGGTLLIDCSGSMNINSMDIDEVITRRPAATIAGYGSDKNKDRSGVLAIAARMGMTAESEILRDSIGGGNVVDGPALLWLSRQPEPRVWICDGVVTGVGDIEHPLLTTEAFDIARRARVKVYLNIETYLGAGL